MAAFIIIVLIVLFGTALLVLLSAIALYARLVKLRATVSFLWSNLRTLLGERHDLTDKTQLREFEDNIAPVASDYNAAVRDYNIAIETFPAQILAKLFHMKKVGSFDTTIS
ncbi:hypothetical protein NBG4_70002 [Candidatus Sulfobium mesophilum]|uniref:LemA family protein n=1 Tax=Candidatus Sulfobium mesophilum TaxID=2016548 RepID=A0A2U3QK17_9BACT|nr:hypothetical protein NBG4_70002 [Candidatus Sulfobium mesophilum]